MKFKIGDKVLVPALTYVGKFGPYLLGEIQNSYKELYAVKLAVPELSIGWDRISGKDTLNYFEQQLVPIPPTASVQQIEALLLVLNSK